MIVESAIQGALRYFLKKERCLVETFKRYILEDQDLELEMFLKDLG